MEGRVWGQGYQFFQTHFIRSVAVFVEGPGRCLPSLGNHLRDEFPFIPCLLPGGSESDGFIGINV